jgi:hypothetical protein
MRGRERARRHDDDLCDSRLRLQEQAGHE